MSNHPRRSAPMRRAADQWLQTDEAGRLTHCPRGGLHDDEMRRRIRAAFAAGWRLRGRARG